MHYYSVMLSCSMPPVSRDELSWGQETNKNDILAYYLHHYPFVAHHQPMCCLSSKLIRMTATLCHMKDDCCVYRRSYAPPCTCVSAALPVVPHSLFLMIAVSRNMGHATTMKVPGLNGWEIGNLFATNVTFLRKALTPLTKNSSLYKIILLKIILSSSILFVSITGRRFLKR